jgi:hypothetical protein
MEAICNLSPSLPRYYTTWDLDIVLQFLRDQESNSGLNIGMLSMKLAFLLAVVGILLVAELSSLWANC